MLLALAMGSVIYMAFLMTFSIGEDTSRHRIQITGCAQNPSGQDVCRKEFFGSIFEKFLPADVLVLFLVLYRSSTYLYFFLWFLNFAKLTLTD